jgi:hypothetical protein
MWLEELKITSSKKTVQILLNELEREEIITIKKVKPNSRGYKLFLNEGNILIVFNKQIKDFNEEFKN